MGTTCSTFPGLQLKALRQQFRLTQAQLAARMSTTQQTIARWENGSNDIPVAQLKELAVLFQVSVDQVLGIDTPYEDRGQSPFAIPSDVDQTPYGTLKLSMTIGERAYPVEDAARLSLLSQMDAFDLQSEDATRAWLYCWSLDNRILFVNPASLIGFELLGDDVEAMPEYAHPEVYQAMEDWEIWEDLPYEIGALVQAECEALVEREGEELSVKRMTHVRVTSLTGEDHWHPLDSPADTEAYFALHLEASSGIRPNRMIRTQSEGYYRDRFVNLSQVAMLEIPMNRYHKLVAIEA